MMYESKLAAAIKVNGKVLREFNKDTVYIPFGSEYSILLKNLNTKRALVNIFVDGQNIVEGGLVLNAGQEVDLERFVKNGNLTEGNRLKFIERTAGIEQHRGVKLEDGLVRVEFQFEQPQPVYRPSPIWTTTYGNNRQIYPQGGISGATPTSYNVGGVLRSVDFSANGATVQAQAGAAIDQYCADNGIKTMSELHDGAATMDWMEAPKNDVGITVPGSKSTQKFSTVHMGTMEAEKFSMVFKLLGQTVNNPVQKPVTVKAKQHCDTCGHTNKATAKFCNKCGTALEIYA
jgi:hypothetical protein